MLNKLFQISLYQNFWYNVCAVRGSGPWLLWLVYYYIVIMLRCRWHSLSNSICWLQEGVFTNMHQLERLSLDHNAITFVEPRVFDESANLSLLSYIDLSNNNMTELEPWPFIRAQHREMFVKLARNPITKFTNAIQWSFDCSSPRIFTMRLDVSRNNIRHITDFIYGWNIDGIWIINYTVSDCIKR